MDKRLPNFRHLGDTDGKIYGMYNTVTSVNPYNCHFVVKYPDGKIIKGKNLFTTGWDDIPNGFEEFSYVLSTGHVIPFPKYKAFLPLIECSDGIEGSRIFHAINVHCLTDTRVEIYKIILKQDKLNKFKIGDVIVSAQPLPKEMVKSWKYTS